MTIKLAASAVGLLFFMAGAILTDPADSRAGAPDPLTPFERYALHRVEQQVAPPRFVAEPEDPTKVGFVAEPEDTEMVCFLPVDGPIDVCESGERPTRLVIPGYARTPTAER